MAADPAAPLSRLLGVMLISALYLPGGHHGCECDGEMFVIQRTWRWIMKCQEMMQHHAAALSRHIPCFLP